MSRISMYHRRIFSKWGLNCKYHTRRWNRISIRVQYESMRRSIQIYPPCRNLHLLELIIIVWRKLPKLFSRKLASINFNISIFRWSVIRGVRTSPVSATSVFTTTTATATAKDTTTAKYFSTYMSCSCCVDLKCIIFGIVLKFPSCHRFELANISTKQIVEFVESLFRNW